MPPWRVVLGGYRLMACPPMALCKMFDFFRANPIPFSLGELMRVLVLGGGGREHALVWKLRQSPRITQLYCAPGNAGIAQEATCVDCDLRSLDSIVECVLKISPALVVVGPELPLSLGVADELQRRGIPVFGPTRAAAQLETSKSFSKEFMSRHRIPTALYVQIHSADEIRDALANFSTPIVVKADGLAAGKGVVIAQTKEEAAQVAAAMLEGSLGDAGSRVLFEEFLEGEEISFLVISDGKHAAPLVAAQDHKRIGDGDTGPNTGGMGAYSTSDLIDRNMRDWLLRHIARPVIDGMAAEGIPYSGILYCGLMMTARGPQVLEFNCRFGDPETQPILMRLECDLLDAFEATVAGRVSDSIFRWSPEPSVCVVMAAAGYPGVVQSGQPITGLEEAGALEGVKVFHAGTKRSNGDIVTAGGRVLGVTARGADLESAVERAYAAVRCIQFDGMQYRRDIAHRRLKK
jgi:phosphoribosylamine--glycine ligase